MAIVDHELLRKNYEAVTAKLRANEQFGLMRPSVSARLIEDVSVSTSFSQYDREFTLYGDEALSRGGRERGPSPMRYFLSGIAFCMLGWYAKGASFSGCEVESLEMDVHTLLDMRGEHGLDDSAVHPQWLVWDIRVTSPSSKDTVVAMIDWGDARCPLGVFARRAVEVHQVVRHNGEVILDNIPDDRR